MKNLLLNISFILFLSVSSFAGCNDINACNYLSTDTDDLDCYYGAINDTWDTAIDMGVGDFSIVVDNSFACIPENPPVEIPGNGCNSQSGWCTSQTTENAGVWYTFTSISWIHEGSISTSDDGVFGLMDTQIALFNANGDLIGANDDNYSGCCYSTIYLTCALEPNTQYWILVDSYSENTPNGTCILELFWNIEWSDCWPIGCINPEACNYDPFAYSDDGSCEYSSCTDCSNDLNLDGSIDEEDYLILLENFGCVDGCIGDTDGDLDVDVQDLVNFNNFFGLTCE